MTSKIIVKGEESFQIPSTRFTIGKSESGLTFQYSIDRENWEDLAEIDAGVNWPVTNNNPANWFKFEGNTEEILIGYDNGN